MKLLNLEFTNRYLISLLVDQTKSEKKQK